MTSLCTWIVVHDLGRSGAPIALARMLRWHRATARAGGFDRTIEGGLGSIHVIAHRGGPLAGAVASEVASLTVLEPDQGRSPALTAAVAAAQLGIPAPGEAFLTHHRRRAVRSLPRPDVVVVHGAGAWPVWASLERATARPWLALHLHELSIGVRRSVPTALLGELASRPDAIAMVCQPDAALHDLLGPRARAVSIVPGCTDEEDGPPRSPSGPTSASRRGAGAPAVVAVGEAGWRKGTDRFLALARQLTAPTPAPELLWIGAEPGPGWAWSVDADLPVRWTGALDDPWAVVPEGSVLAIPSREDPLPLVALEAGIRGLPVVAAATGGLPSLLAEGRGWVAPGHDVRALEVVVREALGPAGAERAERLRAHVAECFRPDAVGPRWVAALRPA